MFIFNVYNDSPVKDVVVEYLKSKGVKYKIPKKSKEIPPRALNQAVYQTPLSNLSKRAVHIKNGNVMIEIPEFLDDIFSLIENNIQVEGIFRKAGSVSKQREYKQLINSKMPLPETCHVVDACNLVKMFLRELPDPLIPYSMHDTLVSCLLIPGEDAQREMLLLSCLLISRENLNVLAYVLEFLAKVAGHSSSNKMDEKNLAVVVTPSMMPIDSKMKLNSQFNINHLIPVVEMLIKSAEDIGVLPEHLAELVRARRGSKKRSASITRMFTTGIRKMVRRASSPPPDVPPAPEAATQKRKSIEILPPAVEVKRRREMADTTPRMCRMGAYSSASLRRSEGAKGNSAALLTSSKNIPARSLALKGRQKQGLKSSKSTGSLLMMKKKNLERKLSNMTWGKRRSSIKSVTSPTTANDESQNEADDCVTIPRSQYEDMVTRVSCMEKLLQDQIEEKMEIIQGRTEPADLADQLGKDLRIRWSIGKEPSQIINSATPKATAVQEAFERTVEQTDQLAPQLRKDVKLRWSSERRVARSPSERKIGSIRRRSRELARSNSADAKMGLQRGRPNTRQTGLRSPRELSDPRRSPRRRPTHSTEQWRPASAVLASPSLASRFFGPPQKRDSIASLRKNNIGMVHAKAKFFDSLNQSADAESDRSNQSMERRLQAVQAELQQQHRPLKENRQPAIKAALCAPSAQLKTPRSVRMNRSCRATPLKALPDNLNTPLRGLRRSPRILSRAITLQASSTRTP